jgi:HEAT repeat protein
MTREPARPLGAGPARPLPPAQPFAGSRTPSRSDAVDPANRGPAADESLESINKKLQEDLKKRAEEREARERERKGPEPSDPAYLDKMADRMSSTNILYRSQAIDALLQADPATASAETRTKVAKAFKALAEGDNTYHHEKAVEGLVKWAGKYSVPVLIAMLGKGRTTGEKAVVTALAELSDARAVPALVKLLGNGQFCPNEELILTTLIAMKDAQAAPALAARIVDRRFGQCACDGLRAMGPAAEGAVMAVADTPDPQICLTAIGLLGEIGTEKCFDLMRRAEESRNRAVRLAAMATVANINKRRLAEKSEPKDE